MEQQTKRTSAEEARASQSVKKLYQGAVLLLDEIGIPLDTNGFLCNNANTSSNLYRYYVERNNFVITSR